MLVFSIDFSNVLELTMTMKETLKYRVTLVVSYLGWVDFDLCVPSSCPPAQPVLPNSNLPKQNLADSGTTKSKSTQPR